MRIDSQFPAADSRTHHPRLPQPGEIWEVNRFGRHPLGFSGEEMQRLYSETARQFLAGTLPPRYVAIVREPEPELERTVEDEMAIVSVMVLSAETQFISGMDLLIPSEISGVDRDLLAETWQVLPMLACNLSHPVGQRLSREVYDILLDVGDANLGLLPAAPSQESIQVLGLKIGTAADRSPEIEEFHQREREWSDVLSIPLAAYHRYQKTMALATQIADAALEVERELATPSRIGVNLSQWLQNLFDRDWLSWESFWEIPGTNLAWSTRNLADFPEIDSELFGTRRVKLIDWGLEVAGSPVALAVAVVPKSSDSLSVLLRVYPTGDRPYLPSDLKLILLDEFGQILREVTAREADIFLQLKLGGQPEEKFSVCVALGEANITEDFTL